MPEDRSLYTTLWITKTNHTELDKIGTKGETYDQILTRLLKVYKKYGSVYEKGIKKNAK